MSGSGRERPLRDTVRHTLVYGVGNVSVALLSLVLVPVYTYHLTPSDYGLLALLLALYGFLGRLYDFGLTNSVGRFYFDYRGSNGELGRMAATTVAYLAVHAGVLSGLLLLFAPTVSIAVTGDPGSADLVRLIAATLFADALAIVPLTLIRMEERSRWFVILTTARFGTALVLNILFVVVFGWGVRGILLGGAITSGALVLLLIPEFVRHRGGGFSVSVLREMLRFGLPFLPVPLSLWLIDYSDRYLLEIFRTRDELGFYALGYKVAQVMQLAVVAFSMGWAPLRYRIYERDDARDVYRRLTTFYLVGAGLLGVAIVLVSREVVALVAPDTYAPAVAVVPMLVLSYATFGLYVILLTGMGVTRRTLPMAWIAVVAAATNVSLNFVAIPRFGMVGAAGTTLLANLILAWGAWRYSQKVYAIPYDWGTATKVLVASVAVVGAGWLVEPSGIWAGTGAALLFVGAFTVLLFVSGVLRSTDLAAARGWVRDVRRGRRT